MLTVIGCPVTPVQPLEVCPMARWLELCLLGLLLPSWAARLAAPTGLKKAERMPRGNKHRIGEE